MIIKNFDDEDEEDWAEWDDKLHENIDYVVCKQPIYENALKILEEKLSRISWDMGCCMILGDVYYEIRKEFDSMVTPLLEEDERVFTDFNADYIFLELFGCSSTDRDGEFASYLFKRNDDKLQEIWAEENHRYDSYIRLDEESYTKLNLIQGRYYIEMLKKSYLGKGEPEKYLEEYREALRKAFADKVAYHSAAASCVLPKEKEEPKE